VAPSLASSRVPPLTLWAMLCKKVFPSFFPTVFSWHRYFVPIVTSSLPPDRRWVSFPLVSPPVQDGKFIGFFFSDASLVVRGNACLFFCRYGTFLSPHLSQALSPVPGSAHERSHFYSPPTCVFNLLLFFTSYLRAALFPAVHGQAFSLLPFIRKLEESSSVRWASRLEFRK